MSFPPIAASEDNSQTLFHSLDSTNNTSKHLPLRKRINPILKWQPVETPEEHHKQYPATYPESEVFFDMNNNNKRTIEEINPNEQIKKVKRGRPSTKHLIKPVEQPPSQPPQPQQKFSRPLPEENTLYCICKRPYDIPRFMIACDRCDQWFHGECIEISEKQGEFIDLYFCENCSKITGKRTSWKPKCANTNCEKAARIGTHQGHLSKYCSDSCGMQVARARIELAGMKNPLSRGRLSSFADMDDRARLSRVKDERLYAKAMITLCQHKLRFLQLATDKINEQDMCGFDSRLSWPDTIWEKVHDVDSEMTLLNSKHELVTAKPFTVCSAAKKCSKHTNWQKLKFAEIEQERSEQFVILTMLERERQQIKARMKKRREDVDLVEYLENGTIVHS
ncbi:hypothetical protein G6F47_001862 [Rhizopus delemar]|uniref:CXXC-type zinc finger protein 1 n=2 Tax=Rhizopus TaxID=4842 RepID=A0A9P6ZED9_9FUNG|nr:hypothetical protein G6F54_002747 [Rhizopus delemar]KAG1552042.1 hypothetical protein G6F51_001472 [Rhizopus arrhizus]KAG1508374.1 hypothetical protein G6F53_008237 [Rhizopus delemar]KAG1576383.1 hypothetical protein G6F50_000263 [Rhizopus delemar]KAG1603410.1 hypothetical protein G6F47_001862 [Rhizopus delemar]